MQWPAPTEVPIESIRLARFNPRTISPEMMHSLKGSLLKHGMVLNLVIQKKGTVLLGGHQRLRAVRELYADHGWKLPKTVWATVVDCDDAKAKQLNIALNKVGGEFDPLKLAELADELRPIMTADDIIATGFTTDALDELAKLLEPDEGEDEEEVKTFAQSVTLSVPFDNTADRDTARALLTELAVSKSTKPARVLLEALRGMRAVQ